MEFNGKFMYIAHQFIFLRLNPCALSVDRVVWWFENSVSQLLNSVSQLLNSVSQFLVRLSAEGAKNVSRSWISPLQRWGSLTIAFTGKFVYIALKLILLQLNPFALRGDREVRWFEHSVSQLWVRFSVEGAKSVSQPWISPLRSWGTLTMKFNSKFVYVAHYFIWLRLNSKS